MSATQESANRVKSRTSPWLVYTKPIHPGLTQGSNRFRASSWPRKKPIMVRGQAFRWVKPEVYVEPGDTGPDVSGGLRELLTIDAPHFCCTGTPLLCQSRWRWPLSATPWAGTCTPTPKSCKLRAELPRVGQGQVSALSPIWNRNV